MKERIALISIGCHWQERSETNAPLGTAKDPRIFTRFKTPPLTIAELSQERFCSSFQLFFDRAVCRQNRGIGVRAGL